MSALSVLSSDSRGLQLHPYRLYDEGFGISVGLSKRRLGRRTKRVMKGRRNRLKRAGIRIHK
jgi:hypothetical protein